MRALESSDTCLFTSLLIFSLDGDALCNLLDIINICRTMPRRLGIFIASLNETVSIHIQYIVYIYDARAYAMMMAVSSSSGR